MLKLGGIKGHDDLTRPNPALSSSCDPSLVPVAVFDAAFRHESLGRHHPR
jgi:hypothetical protein